MGSCVVRFYRKNFVIFCLACSTSKDCKNGWMCNFDYDIDGFCEDCEDLLTADDCYASGFATEAGINECVQQCTFGNVATTTGTSTTGLMNIFIIVYSGNMDFLFT